MAYRIKRVVVLFLTIFLTGCGTGIKDEKYGGEEMQERNGLEYTDVTFTGVDVRALSEEEYDVLSLYGRYSQAMCDAALETLRELVAEEMTFTHMSGLTQTREEYFADIAKGRLNYRHVEIQNPIIEFSGDFACITGTTVLTANAYGARGSWPFAGRRWFARRDGSWVLVNSPTETE